MCAIVDANMASRFFGDPVDEGLRPLWDWIYSGRGMLVVGGQLAEELDQLGDARRLIRNWERARLAHVASREEREEVEAETRRLQRTGQCRSDDPHVVALARVTGVRLLCSGDELLHADFDDRDLINNPRGKVYQYASHAHLLRHSRACPFRARRR